MRDILSRSGTVALIAGMALAVSACGGGGQEANEAVDSNLVDSNALFEEPANDASAMESVSNVAEPVPELNAGNAADANAAAAEGEDTGTTGEDSNVSGM